MINNCYVLYYVTGGKKSSFIVQGFDLYLALKASTSSTLYLEEGLCGLLLLSVCMCTVLVCFAVSLRYQALPVKEHENNVLSTKRRQIPPCWGENQLCQIN